MFNHIDPALPLSAGRRPAFRCARLAAAIAGLALLATAACSDDAFRLPDPAVRYIAFGDSSTAGPAEHDYVDFLRERLGEPTNAFSNEGRGGETADDGADRLESYLDQHLFPNAHTLLYWEGATGLIDFLQEYDPLLAWAPAANGYPFETELDDQLDHIQAAIERSLAAGQGAGLSVYAATYFFLPSGSFDCDPLFLDVLLPGQSANANEYVSLLNDRIRAAAAAQGAVLVDVATLDVELRANGGVNYENCNHLSAAGNEIVAGLWHEVIAANR